MFPCGRRGISDALYYAIRQAISFTNYGLNSLGLGRRRLGERARLMQESDAMNNTNATDGGNNETTTLEDLVDGFLHEPVSGFDLATGQYVRQTQYSDAAMETLEALFNAVRGSGCDRGCCKDARLEQRAGC